MAGDVVHTRYVRKHSNSGLFAVTTLPLWSLNLLDHAEVLVSWLSWFIDHAGVANSIAEEKTELAEYSPDKIRFGCFVIALRWQWKKSLDRIVGNDTVKLLFDLNSLDINK